MLSMLTVMNTIIMAKRDYMVFSVIMAKMMRCCVINVNSDEYYHHGLKG